MIKFYINQELSQKLQIKLSRWKRWSREFLPPDPLGGLQSGYARQYNLDQAFTVFLGGYLVGDLKFTIPEARLILHDLHDWLVAHRFYFDYAGSALSAEETGFSIQYHQIAICRAAAADTGGAEFFYCIRGVTADESADAEGKSGHQKRFIEYFIDSGGNPTPLRNVAGYRVLNISVLHDTFLNALNDNHASS